MNLLKNKEYVFSTKVMPNMNDPWSIIPQTILTMWRQKYGEYLMACETDEFIVFFENGRLDCFHPSGDKLARYHKTTDKVLYKMDNETTEEIDTYLLYLKKRNNDDL